MKKLIIVFILAVFGLPAMAQTVLDGIYEKENVQTRRMIPYTYLREADVMWSNRIWRVLDLNEKMNLALRYPLSETTSDRKNLIDLLMHSVNEGSLTAYSTLDDEFTLPMTSEEIEKIGNSGTDTTWVTEPDPPYETKMVVVEREFSYDKIIAFRIKEEWFFDKQRSVMDVRVIGIAPMMYSEDEFGNVREGAIKVPIFWIYYPEARKILANNEVFNRHNDAERLSFDDVFQKRLFASYIFKESNVFDRRIESYKQGINALLEAERIKNEIFEMEHDLWEY
jgi:gliding motility associated protien GldN